MDSREIVQRVLAFEDPPRIAASFPAPYWHDFAHGGYRWPRGPENIWHQTEGGRWEYIDEFGNLWARLESISKGEVAQGALKSLDDVETFELPDLTKPEYYEEAQERYESQPDKYRLGSLPGFAFNITRKLRKLDQYFMDLLLEPEAMKILLRRTDDLLEGMIGRYAEIGADAIMFGEDWGTQKALMIKPDTWRELFKPGFVRLCKVAHDAGMRVFMHSCGKITSIIPDLIDAGIDVLQFDQPRLHGFDNLHKYAGQVTYWCPVDIQTTLQTGDLDLIEQETIEQIEMLGTPHGGVIGGYYSSNEAIGIDPDVQDAACRFFMKHGVYREAELA